jgi:hypothetical protein
VWGIVLSIFSAAAVGLFFAESDDALMRRAHFAVAALGIMFTGVIVYRILTQDISQHHYRETLRVERDAERVNAEIELLNARRALYAAKERAIYTPLPGRTMPRIAEPIEPAIFVNGKRVNDPMEEDEFPEPAPEDDGDEDDEREVLTPPRWVMMQETMQPQPEQQPAQLTAPYRSTRSGIIVNESAEAYDLRMHKLARDIYDLCRDVNPPTQADIKERIPLTKGGLLRSNDDITRALNILASRRLIEPEKGQGITRHWLDGQGGPLPKMARRKGITSNVPVVRT